MAINSKKKGNRGERKTVEILNKHFETTEFARVPTSGAIATIHNLSQNSQKSYCGDIITPDNFKFSIENKYGYDIDLYNIFQKDNGDKKKFIEFIEQAIKDSKKTKKTLPLVIYTRTRKKPLIGIQKNNIKDELLSKLDQFLTIKLEVIKEDSTGSNQKETDIWIFSDLIELLDKFPKEFFFLISSEIKNEN
jgi:hypothetical protein